jgi:hypothetical protein
VNTTAEVQPVAGIVNIAAALLRAQQKIEGVSKDATNPHFDSKFASLTAVIEAVVPALNAEGIVVIQAPVPPPFEGYLALSTTLIHAASGESISGTAVVPLPKDDPQGYASAMTYTRRISLGSFIGLKFKDDDANEASHAPTQRPAARPRPSPIQGEKPAVKAAGWGTKAKAAEEPAEEPAKAPPRGKTGVFPTVKKGTGKAIDVKADRTPATHEAGAEEGGDASDPE